MSDPVAVRTVDAPLVEPSSNSGLLEVFRRRYLLKLLVSRELSARYQASVLGLLWSYIQPATRFAMYYFVIGGVLQLHAEVQYFGIHIFTALIFVNYFTTTFSAGTRSIVANRALVQKMAMPREMFPVASMIVSLYHTLPQLGILLVATTAAGWRPDWYGVGAGFLSFAIIIVFGTALALLFSALNVMVRDFQNFVGTLTTFVHFSVPMIYTYEMVAPRFGADHVWIYLSNPVAEAVLLGQRCFWVGVTDDPSATIKHGMPDNLMERGLLMLLGSMVFLAISQWVFSRLEKRFPEAL